MVICEINRVNNKFKEIRKKIPINYIAYFKTEYFL